MNSNNRRQGKWSAAAQIVGLPLARSPQRMQRASIPKRVAILVLTMGVIPTVEPLVCLCGWARDYSAYSSWEAMDRATNALYATVIRVSGSTGYTGFWFFGMEQFDAMNRYALAMTVYFQDRDVKADDVAEVGYFDLQNGNKWTRIGTTTAWNWQQGCRLQWRPGSDKIVWNDRADDNSHYIARVSGRGQSMDHCQ